MFPEMAARELHQHPHASADASLHAHADAAQLAREQHSGTSVSQPGSHAGFSARAERLASWLSFACAIHCLVMPLAIGVLPLLGATGGAYLGETAELGLTALVVVSALTAMIWGYRRHRDARFVALTALGLTIYLIGHALGHASAGSWYAVSMAVVGGLTLAGSSFFSARLSHVCVDPGCAA